MKIHKINQQTVFKSSFRQYTPKANKDFKHYGKMIIKTYSKTLREDIDLRDLLRYAVPHFKDVPVVNTYSLACSDLSEAYSYKIAVMEEVPKELQSKFSNVFASDIDKRILAAARSGRINIFSSEFAEALRLYGYDLTKYFKDKKVSVMVQGDDISESDTISSYEPIKELKEKLIIKRSDILTELKNIKDNGNSIVMSRNALPYTSDDYIDEVIYTANRNLKKGSLFAIGEFDNQAIELYKKLLAKDFFCPLRGKNNNIVFEHI